MSVLQMAKVWNLDLPPNKKLILLAYADHADDEGNNVFPSLPRIAHKTGYEKQQVRRISRELVDDGLMELVEKGNGRGHPHRYKLTLEKGVILEPFKRVSPEGEERVSKTEERVSSEATKGITDDTRTINREPSVEPSSPTGSGENARTQSQKLMDHFYIRLQEDHNVKLRNERYSFHLGKFRDILNIDKATKEEQERVIDHMVNVYAKAPKINAVDALADVRLGRDTGEAWSGPAPWEEVQANNEPAHPHSEEAQEMRDKPRKKEWYMAFYPDASAITVRDMIAAGSTHTEIVERLEGASV